MEETDTATVPHPQTRQPKKRFVGRRTADAQAETETSADRTDTTAIQKGSWQTVIDSRGALC
jgi:2-(3-amino-3-carboxypropyl)histidine synthase